MQISVHVLQPGLQVLEREKKVFEVNPQSQPDLESYTYLIERQLKPEARKDISELLGRSGNVNEQKKFKKKRKLESKLLKDRLKDL